MSFYNRKVVLVTGEEDNVFTPTYDPGTAWNGFAAQGEVGYAQTIRICSSCKAF